MRLDAATLRANTRRALGHVSRSLSRPPRPHEVLRPRVYARPADLVGFGLIAAFIAVLFLDPHAHAWALSFDDSVWTFFHTVTRYGKADWFLWPMGLTLLAILIASGLDWGLRERAVLHHWGTRLGFIVAGVAIPGLVAALVKFVVGRARPEAEGSTGILDITGFAMDADFQSFPSGHTTNAVTLAVALTVLWPRYWALFLAYPLVIATSRVMTIDHYPSDVTGAWLFGTAGVLWLRNWCARRHLVFRPRADGRVEPRRLPHIARATWPALRAMAARRFVMPTGAPPAPSPDR